MFKRVRRSAVVVSAVAIALSALPGVVAADHWLDGLHWARASNPFTLQLGDNVSNTWDSHLATASNDWSVSLVMDTPVVPGGTRAKQCRPTPGRVEVCSANYGTTGWLGTAQFWTNGDHITAATARVNDTYMSRSPYNTPAYRNFVMCHEVGHTFGLAHRDVDHTNLNIGSCMDYTRDPDGPPSNEHPDAHDYEQLELIYAHTDATSTVGGSSINAGSQGATAGEWGRLIHTSADGHESVYVRGLGEGRHLFTFVLWAD